MGREDGKGLVMAADESFGRGHLLMARWGCDERSSDSLAINCSHSSQDGAESQGLYLGRSRTRCSKSSLFELGVTREGASST